MRAACVQSNGIIGDALRRKLAVARAERDRQVASFTEITRTIEHDVKEKWQGEINAWLADQSKPNPYVLERNGELCVCCKVMVTDHFS